MARKSKVPTPAELARLYGAGHDALTAALDAGCLPSDLQNKWPNLLGTLRRVEGQPYHHPWVKDPLTDDEKRVLAWEFRKAAQRAEEALKRCRGAARNNPRMRESKKRLAFSVLNNTFGSPENQKRGWASEEQAANSAATLLAPRIGVSYSTALSVVREWYAGHRNNPAPWAKVFG